MKTERASDAIVNPNGAQGVIPLRARRRPVGASRLLTGAQAMVRFAFPHYQALYAFVADEGISRYVVGKRELYPELEIERALIRNGGPGVFPDGPVREPYRRQEAA